MNPGLIIEDKKYISSKMASEKSGYAADYVGQLCRGGKLKAKMVGRTWYVLEEDLDQYLKVGIPETCNVIVSKATATSGISTKTANILKSVSEKTIVNTLDKKHVSKSKNTVWYSGKNTAIFSSALFLISIVFLQAMHLLVLVLFRW